MKRRLALTDSGWSTFFGKNDPRAFFLIVFGAYRAHTPSMTTTNKLLGLSGWSIRCASVLVFAAFCASAFGDPSKDGGVLPKQARRAQKTSEKMCYTFISGSAMSQPCDRLGPIPTTSYPMDRVGGYSTLKK
jgi:hypothetical protein